MAHLRADEVVALVDLEERVEGMVMREGGEDSRSPGMVISGIRGFFFPADHFVSGVITLHV